MFDRRKTFNKVQCDAIRSNLLYKSANLWQWCGFGWCSQWQCDSKRDLQQFWEQIFHYIFAQLYVKGNLQQSNILWCKITQSLHFIEKLNIFYQNQLLTNFGGKINFKSHFGTRVKSLVIYSRKEQWKMPQILNWIQTPIVTRCMHRRRIAPVKLWPNMELAPPVEGLVVPPWPPVVVAPFAVVVRPVGVLRIF